MQPFSPVGSSVKVAASTVSAAVALGVVNPPSVRVYNASPSVALIAFGAANVDAQLDGAGSIAIAPGAVEVFGAGSITHAAAILVSGSGDVWFTPGAGI